MEKLIRRFNTKLRHLPFELKRYLFDDIDWDNRLIAIKGSRVVGKTTLLLQHIKLTKIQDGTTLYVSLDDIYFQANTLVDLAEEFYQNGGKYLYLDEVHKYKNWSLEIKNIYDTYQDLYIVFTGSSILEIHQGDGDLSRRVVSYDLRGLSLREYMMLETGQQIPVFDLNDILKNHISIASDITAHHKVIPIFKSYLEMGYYPFYRENKNSYHGKIMSIINQSLESDIPSVYNTEFKTIAKLKRLLYVIATSVPYQPNISKLSETLETTSRTSTLQYLWYLEKSNLISNLKTSAKGNNYMNKPDKIYLENTNLVYAIGNELSNNGNLRETFFLNQLASKHKINTSKKSDFLVNGEITFEIGGRDKKSTQIKGVQNSYIASDNLEIGFGNKIPLWLFGMLY